MIKPLGVHWLRYNAFWIIAIGALADPVSTEIALHHLSGVESNDIINKIHSQSWYSLALFRVIGAAVPAVVAFFVLPRQIKNISAISSSDIVFIKGNFSTLSRKEKVRITVFLCMLYYGIVRGLIAVNNVFESGTGISVLYPFKHAFNSDLISNGALITLSMFVAAALAKKMVEKAFNPADGR